MKVLASIIGQHKDVGADLEAVFKFKISNPDKCWIIDLKQRKVYEGDVEADTTFMLTDEDFVKMFKKEADPAELFMEQKLRFEGDMGLAMQFQSVTDSVPEEAF